MCYNLKYKNKNYVNNCAVEKVKKKKKIIKKTDKIMGTIIAIIAVGVLLYCYGGDIADFFCKIICSLFIGVCAGLGGGAIGWLVATLFFSAGVLGFIAGFIVGVIILIYKVI